MVKVKLPCYTTWRYSRKEEVQLLLILDLSIRLGEWSAPHPGHALVQGKAPSTHWTGGWVGPKARHTDYKTNPLPLTGIEPSLSSLQSNTILIELSQFIQTVVCNHFLYIGMLKSLNFAHNENLPNKVIQIITDFER
jgi:hypothetical protein